ncbi:hypothetical protein PF004_g26325 [Phytophthora fragariae]|uniref:Uncharacterized protein n=1 Tax=Phytophthora fragariae TaxID=53985 RepID=A0A6G0MQ61_9STRA|nr:hypothetical protein PF004_g26325 [Phytophthora fragariae]
MQLGASRFMMYTSCCFSTAPKSSASLLGSVASFRPRYQAPSRLTDPILGYISTKESYKSSTAMKSRIQNAQLAFKPSDVERSLLTSH